MEYRVLTPQELEPRDAEAWEDLRRRAGLLSPFLSPGWVQALACAGGPDAKRLRILIAEDQGKSVAFLPARLHGGLAGPPGAPLCDYQALIARPGVELDRRRVLTALGAARLDFDGLLTPGGLFAEAVKEAAPTFIIDLSAGYEAYEGLKRAQGSDVLKDCVKRRAKLEKDHGPVAFEETRDEAVLDQLIDWKRRQYAETAQPDIFAAGWPLALLRRLLGAASPACRARLFALRQDGELIAAHLALAGERSLHAWFIAHNETYARYSPGALLLHSIIRLAAAEGLQEVDLGPGDYVFKRRFASEVRSVHQGFAGRPSAAALVRGAFWRLRRTAQVLPLGAASSLPGKAMRRLDLLRNLA